MKPLFVAALCATALLAGCAPGSDAWVNAQYGSDGISVDEVDATKGLYRVSVMNTVDFGWNGDNPEDRQRVAKVAMKQICQDAALVSEVPIPMGSYLLGSRERIKYSMTMRCPDSQESPPQPASS
ncbi:hypothetical protein [Bordetella bronchiseptica]|uniref:hypothetical protein n=1 Tax=Bordetella bronchiseptica TaxID=518 RepID=UPI0012678C75|nr:hypothetical protein [Bordetella bronchiseptica]